MPYAQTNATTPENERKKGCHIWLKQLLMEFNVYSNREANAFKVL